MPHYHVVRYAPTGAVRSIHLIDTVTGREIVTSYPHGIKFAIADELTPGESDREVRVRTEELQGALEASPTPAPPVPAPVGFATGLPIGWNSSTGPTPGPMPQLHDRPAEQPRRTGELQFAKHCQ